MPITRQLILALCECVEQTYNPNLHSDKLLTQLLQSNPHWELDERQYVVVNFYHMVRFRRLIDYLLEHHSFGSESIAKWAACSLIVGQTWPEWFDHSEIDEQSMQSSIARAEADLKLSYPNWLYELCEQQIGEQWPVIAAALNQPAEQYLRVNTLKTTLPEVIALLAKDNIQVVEIALPSHSALKVESNSHLFRSSAFQSGFFEMQDAGSQQIVPFLQVKPGQKVVDACAGAGGKTLHLAALMENRGRLLAMDIHEHKLDTLKQRAKRAGVHVIETRAIQSSKTVKRQKDKFDRVLLDVPCSGLGVLRRNPDTKWHLNLENIDTLIALQTEILQRYSQMCNVGGKLVYATCSILPAENEHQVERFLENNPNWELEESMTLLPGISSEFDGFYAARLVRKN
ncbi:RsmB/NOP family class I SAM-dependent RNA methyltransferase (plasmid) [Pseudoalteromonas sp. T1lg65]|uniref:RsmB/NOP family class I SAM-dependent RNA methyltransferase n=1 Tax=Pseudoalteromonas sp. T1lg65 TaxID=2077101 RepID=UPI003F793472